MKYVASLGMAFFLVAATPLTTVALQRGVNMGNMLEAPNEGDWGVFVQKEYFDLIKNADFDFIRLPVRWSGHADKSRPYTIDPVFLSRVDQVVDWALARNLRIIIDLHHYNEISDDPWGERNTFLSIWKQIAEHYKTYPPTVIFELLNEPNSLLQASLWNQYLGQALTIIRNSNPTRDVIIGPVQWNSFTFVSELDLPNDPHLVATFHYYLPLDFTHQGLDEVIKGSGRWLATIWTATDDEKAEIVRNFDYVADWSKRHGNIPILLGEFGVYSRAPQDSRIRWTMFVREQAEAHGFAWSYWEFGSTFGVYDPAAEAWHRDLLKALIP